MKYIEVTDFFPNLILGDNLFAYESLHSILQWSISYLHILFSGDLKM